MYHSIRGHLRRHGRTAHSWGGRRRQMRRPGPGPGPSAAGGRGHARPLGRGRPPRLRGARWEKTPGPPVPTGERPQPESAHPAPCSPGDSGPRCARARRHGPSVQGVAEPAPRHRLLDLPPGQPVGLRPQERQDGVPEGGLRAGTPGRGGRRQLLFQLADPPATPAARRRRTIVSLSGASIRIAACCSRNALVSGRRVSVGDIGGPSPEVDAFGNLCS